MDGRRWVSKMRSVRRVLGKGVRFPTAAVILNEVAPMSESSDRALLDLIRRGGPLTVAEMATSLGVTATAIRNRLTRLLGAAWWYVNPSIKTVAGPSTPTGSVSRRKSGWGKTMRTWRLCSGTR